MRSIITDDEERCYLCGSTVGLETHHCLHGTAGRKLGDRWGLTVKLCSRCHRDGTVGVHGRNSKADRQLKRLAQTKFEEKYSHEKWMAVIGRNYLGGKENGNEERSSKKH